jgi:hypothetical protein
VLAAILATLPTGGGGTAAPPPPLVHDVAVWLGGYDLTGALSTVALVASRAELGHITMADDIASSYPGEQQVNADVSGAWSAGVGLPDTVVAPRLFAGSYDEWPLTILPPVAPGAAGADGNVAYNVRSVQHGIQFGGVHGQLLPFSLSSRGRTGRLDRGTVMLPKATRTASVNGTVVALGAITSTKKLVVSVHVFSVTGASGSVQVTVENDDTSGFTSPTTKAIFDAVTTTAGVGRQTKEIVDVSGDTYWRLVATWTPGTNYVLAGVAALVNR